MTWTAADAAAYQRRYRAAARIFGRCRSCGQPTERGSFCGAHRAKKAAETKRWWSRLTPEQKRARKVRT